MVLSFAGHEVELFPNPWSACRRALYLMAVSTIASLMNRSLVLVPHGPDEHYDDKNSQYNKFLILGNRLQFAVFFKIDVAGKGN